MRGWEGVEVGVGVGVEVGVEVGVMAMLGGRLERGGTARGAFRGVVMLIYIQNK